jgi:hypothetical protein
LLPPDEKAKELICQYSLPVYLNEPRFSGTLGTCLIVEWRENEALLLTAAHVIRDENNNLREHVCIPGKIAEQNFYVYPEKAGFNILEDIDIAIVAVRDDFLEYLSYEHEIVPHEKLQFYPSEVLRIYPTGYPAAKNKGRPVPGKRYRAFKGVTVSIQGEDFFVEDGFIKINLAEGNWADEEGTQKDLCKLHGMSGGGIFQMPYTDSPILVGVITHQKDGYLIGPSWGKIMLTAIDQLPGN